MILDLPPNIEQIITAQAKEQGLTPENYLIHHINEWLSERTLGGGEHLLIAMSDDFDAPLDDFKEYM